MDCPRFEEKLFERLEGLLDEAGNAALEAHAAACPRCRELQATLESEPARPGPDFTESVLERTSRADTRQRVLLQLDRDLPALAEIMPDSRFVADVMGATVEADRHRLGHRLRAFWESLARRPRLALEGAYVGAVLLFLLFGTPGSPLADVPRQALAPFQERGTVHVTVSSGAEKLTRFTRDTWQRTGELLTTPVSLDDSSLPTITTWRERTAELFHIFWERTLAPALEWIHQAWLRITGQAPEPTSDPGPRQGDSDDGIGHAA